MGMISELVHRPEPPRLGDSSVELNFQPDGKWRDCWIELLHGNNLQVVRGALLAIAYILDRDPNPTSEALCLLTDSKITPERLGAEIEMFSRATRPDLARRIHVGWFESSPASLNLPKNFGEGFEPALIELIRLEAERAVPQSSTHTVFAELVRAWLRDSPPQTTAAIGGITGASYPTVATVLRNLEAKGLLVRSTDRRVMLRAFPWDEWGRWILASPAARKPMNFVDRTGRPRTPESLLERLHALNLDSVAVGGYFGAQHYYPDIDLTGAPRLDLTVHGTNHSIEPDFVREIDAGLGRTRDPLARPDLVIHFLGSQKADNFEREGKEVWADPLECLADLYEMRLDAQADEMLRHLISRRNQLAHAVQK